MNAEQLLHEANQRADTWRARAYKEQARRRRAELAIAAIAQGLRTGNYAAAADTIGRIMGAIDAD